jgi:colanic acid biosynthesis glycosyl transferase WcaI
MRVLLLNQFYLPDTAPTGWYLHGLARVLVARGHLVKVFCSRRSYDGVGIFPRRENLDGVEVARLPATGFGRRGFAGKIADYASFYLSLLSALLWDRSKPDIIVSLTTPPYIGVLGKLAAWKTGCRHADWIMDLYPDVMFAHGMAKKDGLMLRCLRRLNRFQLKGAGPILTLGPRMAEKAQVYARNGSAASSVTWVPLWSDPELAPWPEAELNPLRAERGWAAGEVVFLYSGNMGLGHRFNEFLEAARRLGPAGPRWVFSGGGKRRAEVEAFAKAHPEARLELLGYVPHARLRAHLASADVHLASLDSAWAGLIVPSKLQASFAIGRPVICVGGGGSETAGWIKESGGGWVVAEDDLDGLMKAVTASLDPAERRRRGEAAREFARNEFQMPVNCARIAELLERGTRAGA